MKASTNALKVRAESLVQVSKSRSIVSHHLLMNWEQQTELGVKKMCDFDERMNSETLHLSVESDGLCATNSTADRP